MKHRLPNGFTLVELLVVIAIIAIMVMLLLPAINAMRESARRTQCMNHITQLIVAVHSHEMTHGHYPAGVRDPVQDPIVSQAQGFHHSWIIPLLPHLEEGNLYRAINHEKSVYHKSNLPAREIQPQVLICPSYAGNRGMTAISNYAAVHHDVEAPIGSGNNGVFFLNSRLGRDEITDGAQYTLFIGERIDEPRNVLGWMSGTRDTLRNTGTPLNRTGSAPSAQQSLSEEFIENYESSDVVEFEELVSRDAPDVVEGAEIEDDESIDVEPLDTTDSVEDESADDASDGETQPPTAEEEASEPVDIWAAAKAQGLYVGGFGSDHMGGGVFAFGDGHVMFIPNDIDPKVYRQLGHRADGQLIDSRMIGR